VCAILSAALGLLTGCGGPAFKESVTEIAKQEDAATRGSWADVGSKSSAGDTNTATDGLADSATGVNDAGAAPGVDAATENDSSTSADDSAAVPPEDTAPAPLPVCPLNKYDGGPMCSATTCTCPSGCTCMNLYGESQFYCGYQAASGYLQLCGD
jgi:hypothetical protein